MSEVDDIRNQRIDSPKHQLNPLFKVVKFRPEFVDVYLSNNFNPCPCGYSYADDEIEMFAKHWAEGHYDRDLFDKHYAQAKKIMEGK